MAASDEMVSKLQLDDLFQEPMLRDDLRFFGIDPERITPMSTTQAQLDDIASGGERDVAALGAYYVFEGSKNGAAFLARPLGPALKLDRGGLRYLDPHGVDQRRLWARFKEQMDGLAFPTEEEDAIVAAAKRTFDHVSAVDDELHALDAEAIGRMVAAVRIVNDTNLSDFPTATTAHV